MCATGPNTRFGIAAASKAQTVVSHSTPEAEIVSADYGLRTIGQPALTLWRTLLGWAKDEVNIIVHEDFAAMIQVMNTGKNPTMRGPGNTHGVSINRLKEAFDEPWGDLITSMVGDIFTKAFGNKDKWTHACRMINMFDMDDLDTAPRIAGGGAKRPS